MIIDQKLVIVARQRVGIASIEFVLFIPIFLGFAIFVAWVFRVHTAVLQAGIDAEAKAALNATILLETNRFQLTDTTVVAHATDLAQLVNGFNSQVKIGSGVVEDMAKRETGEGHKGITRPVGDAVDGHLVLAHAWESDVFSFPTNRREQPPLTLPAAVRGIAPALTDLNVMASLPRIVVDPQAKSENAQRRTELQKDLASSIRSSQAALKDVLEKINSTKQAIAREETKSPVDQAALAKLRTELAKYEEYRVKLQDAIQQATVAQKIATQVEQAND